MYKVLPILVVNCNHMRVNNQNSISYVRGVIVVSAKYPSVMKMTKPFAHFEQYQEHDGIEEYFGRREFFF